MPTIGGFVATTFDRIFTKATKGFQVFEQGGVDDPGVVFGANKRGNRGVQTQRSKVRCADLAAADTVIANYSSTLASSVTVVDQFADSFANVLVCSVVCEKHSDVLGAWVVADWIVIIPVAS